MVVRAWLAAGRPPGKRTLGSFESWAAVVGGILEHAEVPGFLHDTEELYESADAEGQEWREFVRSWWDKFGGMKVPAYDVLRRAVEEGATYGWRRAHKHTDTPEENAIVDQIIQGVLNEVCEYFDFDDEDCPA